MDELLSRLLGSWTLLDWRIEHRDGRDVTRPYGEQPTGLLVYAQDGWMNASIARRERSPLSTPVVRQAPLQEQAQAFVSYFNYAGPFELVEREGLAHVIHRVQWSLNPGFVGTVQERRIAFPAAGELVLSADESMGPQRPARHHVLHWRRPVPSSGFPRP